MTSKTQNAVHEETFGDNKSEQGNEDTVVLLQLL